MDLQMPVMDGFQATKLIREQLNSQIPIIALTANAFKSELENCIKTGMNDYVTKPFEEHKLISCISKWLGVNNPSVASRTKVHNSNENGQYYSLNKLIASSRNDMSYVKRMSEIFIEQTEKSILEIRAAYVSGDLEAVAKLIHRIRPSVDNMGIELVRSEIKEVEKAAKDPVESEELKNKLVFVLSILDKAIQQLKNEKFLSN